jgi:hypothetical protein
LADSSTPAATDFLPYAAYRAADEELTRFFELTHLAYGLSQQLLFRTDAAELEEAVEQPPGLDDLSFGEQSMRSRNVELVCEWIDLAEYAERSGRPVEEVEGAGDRGELGPVEDPQAETPRFIWPADLSSNDRSELPSVGKKSYQVTMDVTAFAASPEVDHRDASRFEETQQQYLRLAHALGEPEEVAERAQAMLTRSAILILWTNFEVFLRETIAEVIRRHPHLLAQGRRAKQTMTYAELVELSDSLTSADHLREELISREIEALRGAGQSVHGMINFLKSELRFTADPYQAWYRWEGDPRKATYEAVMNFKDLRNALVHEGQAPSDSDLDLTEHRFHEAQLMLGALTFRIGRQIATGRYALA